MSSNVRVLKKYTNSKTVLKPIFILIYIIITILVYLIIIKIQK